MHVVYHSCHTYCYSEVWKVRIEGPGIDAIKFKSPNIDSGWERKYTKHNKTFFDNTLEEQND